MMQMKDFAEAERLLRESAEVHRRAYGPGHPAEVGSTVVLTGALLHQYKIDEAIAVAEQALVNCRERGNHYPRVQMLLILAQLHCNQGDLAAVESRSREAVRFCQRSLGIGFCLRSVPRLRVALGLSVPRLRVGLGLSVPR